MGLELVNVVNKTLNTTIIGSIIDTYKVLENKTILAVPGVEGTGYTKTIKAKGSSIGVVVDLSVPIDFYFQISYENYDGTHLVWETVGEYTNLKTVSLRVPLKSKNFIVQIVNKGIVPSIINSVTITEFADTIGGITDTRLKGSIIESSAGKVGTIAGYNIAPGENLILVESTKEIRLEKFMINAPVWDYATALRLRMTMGGKTVPWGYKGRDRLVINDMKEWLTEPWIDVIDIDNIKQLYFVKEVVSKGMGIYLENQSSDTTYTIWASWAYTILS